MATFHGRIKNGVVVLDDATALPEGAEVTVDIVDASSQPVGQPPLGTILERLKSVVGAAKSLPPDAAINIDHYLYGVPKQ